MRQNQRCLGFYSESYIHCSEPSNLNDNVLQILILIPQGIHLFIVNFGLPIYLLWKGGKLLTSILWCWGHIILWAIIWSIILPAIALHWSHDLFMKFPEAIGVFPIIAMGWLHSLVVCTVAYAIIRTIKSWRSGSPNNLT